MGCNASQEPIIIPNENGNATILVEGDDTAGDPRPKSSSSPAHSSSSPAQQQSLSAKSRKQSPQQGQLESNQSEPEVSTTNNGNNTPRSSPGNEAMTPQSVTTATSPAAPIASPEAAVVDGSEEGFMGNKSTPVNDSSPVHIEGEKKPAEPMKGDIVGDDHPSRAQSSSTTKSMSSSATSARSSHQSVAVSRTPSATATAPTLKSTPTPVESTEKTMIRDGRQKSATSTRLEMCSTGASDLANNPANSITETHAEDRNSTIESKDKEMEMLFGSTEEKVEAATKIQAVFRGHKVRATKMKPGDDDSSAKGAAAGGSTDEGAAKTPTKDEFEAEFDPNDKELCSAAVRIQATFRGHLARKGKELKDEKDIQEITKKVAEELDIDLSDPELNKAATKIQATFRRHRKD